MKKEYQHIFEPFTVRRMTMKNRIMMTPMGTNYGDWAFPYSKERRLY